MKTGKVESVLLQGDQIQGTLKDKTQFKTFNPETDYTALIGELQKGNVDIKGAPPKQPSFWTQLVLQLAAPVTAAVLLPVHAASDAGCVGWGRGAMSFGKSRARCSVRTRSM